MLAIAQAELLPGETELIPLSFSVALIRDIWSKLAVPPLCVLKPTPDNSHTSHHSCEGNPLLGDAKMQTKPHSK